MHLSDINADVIGCYRMIRDCVDDVIAALRALEDDYERRGEISFYDVRDRQFNPARRDVHRAPDPSAAYTPPLAENLREFCRSIGSDRVAATREPEIRSTRSW